MGQFNYTYGLIFSTKCIKFLFNLDINANSVSFYLNSNCSEYYPIEIFFKYQLYMITNAVLSKSDTILYFNNWKLKCPTEKKTANIRKSLHKHRWEYCIAIKNNLAVQKYWHKNVQDSLLNK